MAVKDIQNFLFYLTGWQYIRPLLLFSLAGYEPQIDPDLPQNRFGLPLNFFKQHFLSAHISIIHESDGLRNFQIGHRFHFTYIGHRTSPVRRQRDLF
jgi:hypothetical protein